MNLELKEEVQGGDDINLELVSTSMVVKGLLLCEVTKEWELDGKEGNSPMTACCFASGEIYILLYGVGTSRVTHWSGQRWGQRLITSVFHISGSVESPACGLSHLS